ncbi:hypothetical protein N2152v2_003221 [Parachlorella kessleri]
MLQDAILRCSGHGGTVHLAPGTYRTAALLLSGTVAVYLPHGAVIEAGDRAHWYALRLHNCTGCRLTGEGSIDGRGQAWVRGSLPDRKLVRNFKDPSCTKAEECRPRLVGVEQSSQVTISGVTLIDPIYWSLHIHQSSQVMVSNVTIVSDFDIANTDGIDIDSSSDVQVTGCTIVTADDAICLKTTHPGRATERVAVRGCSLKSRSSAVKLGSESRADFRDITFQHLQIVDSHRGLAIQLRDEGSMHSVSFDNITISTRYYNQTWWGGAEPIYVVATPRTAATQLGSASNIRFSRITAVGENGFFIAGAAGRRVTNLTISHTTLDLVKKTDWPGGSQDYRPGLRGLVHTGATAPLWLEHAEHVAVQRVKVIYHVPFREDWETTPHIDPASTAEVSFKDFVIDGLATRLAEGGGSVL